MTNARPGAAPGRGLLDIRREEWPLALLMFANFFLVITCFWILKPLKKGLFIEFYDQHGLTLLGAQFSAAQAELLAKVLNMVVAFAAVVVFTLLSRHLRRQRLTAVFALFFITGFALFSRVLATPGDAMVWCFYLFGDLYSTVMVATFFAFLNDSVTPGAARRLYGPIGLGGVSGGVVGASAIGAQLGVLDAATWLWLCAALTFTVALCAWGAAQFARPATISPAAPDAAPDSGGSAITEGARLVFASRYLLAIVAIVGLYEVISTVVDFQFTFVVAHYLDGPAIGRHFALVYAITNWVSLLVQLLLTSYIMTRFGLVTALLVLPLAIALGSAAFMVLPALWLGSLLSTADNGFSYSINQSAKEALYVPASEAEKYRAKAFIDMFVQRFAKAVAVVISLGITFTVSDINGLRYLCAVVLALLLLWVAAARYAGREFNRRSAQE